MLPHAIIWRKILETQFLFLFSKTGTRLWIPWSMKLLKTFLQKCVPLIFFVSQNAYYCRHLPGLFPGWWGDTLIGQVSRDGWRCFTLKKHPLNQPYCFRFLFYDFGQTILALFVPKEVGIRQADFAIREPLALGPGHVEAKWTAFFLSNDSMIDTI